MLRRVLPRVLIGLVVVVGVVLGGLFAVARPAPDHPHFAQFQRYPLVIAHAEDTGTGLWPGDTFAHLDGAADLGVDVLEMNVHMTRDGAIVLIHDDTVDRTTDGTGTVWELTLAEVQALDAAYHWSPDDGATFPYRGQGLTIPTLEAVFEKYPDYPMIVEIKQTTPSLAQPLCDLIRRHGLEQRVIVPSFSDQAIREFRQACPEVATAAARDEVTAFVLLNYAFLAGTVSPAYQALHVPERSSGITVVTPGAVAAAHQRGVQVHVWTVNDPDDMRRFLDMGVDGLMTDRPDLLLELLGRR
mgnify:CR=1 FL=1